MGITARHNPYFCHYEPPKYAANSSYGIKFRRDPLKTFTCYLSELGTLYVLVDKSSRLFPDAAKLHIRSVFGNL